MARKKKRELSGEEWQARHDAACMIVARKYCDWFNFWHDCRYKPCRSARRCIGDARDCLDTRRVTIPYDADITAQRRMSAETPRTADRFLRNAYHQAPSSAGRRNPRLREARARKQAGREATSLTGP